MRARHEPDGLIYSFLGSSQEIATLTHSQLWTKVKTVAAMLRESSGRHERAILVYPPGLDFIVALFGCMASGLTPIPVYPPFGGRLERSLERIRHVGADADCKLILTTAQLLGELSPKLSGNSSGFACVATNDAAEGIAADSGLCFPEPESLAYLQYTSGSTKLPRGVKITHRNTMMNCAALRDCYSFGRESRLVVWIPPYHDMGLIIGIFLPLVVGFPVTLMAPYTFVQNPAIWLETMSRIQATASVSPNFGYDLCVSKVNAEALAHLDLSHWRVAMSGAEPVSPATLERFANKFAPAGFRKSAFCPSYGLAEATLLVSASVGTAPLVRAFDRNLLESGRAKSCTQNGAKARLLVAHGRTGPGIGLKIVNPVTLEACPTGHVGEIWVSGASVAQGYWNKCELSRETFQADLAGAGGGPFLRTGDMGFIEEDQLYIAGRIKDVIIAAGRKHFPEDLEQCVSESHPAFRGMTGTIFSIDLEDHEVLVVLQKVNRQLTSSVHESDLFRAVQGALSLDNVKADAIVLLKAGMIPRTTSGKVQRHQCRQDFLAGKFKGWAEWRSLRLLAYEGKKSPQPQDVLRMAQSG
jgi:acyl-CoA synthetase (AMP-forming)/AMP-acid ligase II